MRVHAYEVRGNSLFMKGEEMIIWIPIWLLMVGTIFLTMMFMTESVSGVLVIISVLLIISGMLWLQFYANNLDNKIEDLERKIEYLNDRKTD